MNSFLHLQRAVGNQGEQRLLNISASRLQRQVPQDITVQVGPVSGQGGLIHDTNRKRMSIIISPNDSWQIVPRVLNELLSDPDSEKSQRAMKAMLKMKKTDIEKINQAYEGLND